MSGCLVVKHCKKQIQYRGDRNFRGPPSEGRVIRGPPSDGRVIRGPPSVGHVIRGPPSVGHVIRGPPSDGRVIRGPPSESRVIIGPLHRQGRYSDGSAASACAVSAARLAMRATDAPNAGQMSERWASCFTLIYH